MADDWARKQSEEMLEREIARAKERHEKRLAKIAERERALATGERGKAAEIHRQAAERRLEVIKLRDEGRTYADIGKAVGLSAGRCREIVMGHGRWMRRHGTNGKPEDELSTRLANGLFHALDLRGPNGKPITPALVAERLSRSGLRTTYGIGKSSMAELESWLARHGHRLRD